MYNKIAWWQTVCCKMRRWCTDDALCQLLQCNDFIETDSSTLDRCVSAANTLHLQHKTLALTPSRSLLGVGRIPYPTRSPARSWSQCLRYNNGDIIHHWIVCKSTQRFVGSSAAIHVCCARFSPCTLWGKKLHRFIFAITFSNKDLFRLF